MGSLKNCFSEMSISVASTTVNEFVTKESLLSDDSLNKSKESESSSSGTYSTPHDRVSFSNKDATSSSSSFENDTVSSIEISYFGHSKNKVNRENYFSSWSWEGLESETSSSAPTSEVFLTQRPNPPFQDIANIFQCINRSASSSGETLAARTLAGLAETFWRRREYTKAIEAYHELLQIVGAHRSLDKKQENEITALNRKKMMEEILTAVNIIDNHVKFGCEMEQLGDYDEAIQSYVQGLRYGMQYLGHDHLQMSKVWKCIGSCFWKFGRYDDAIHTLKKSIDIHRVSERIDDIDSLNLLGTCYNSVGKYNEALRMHQQALGILSNHSTTSSACNESSASGSFQYIAITLSYMGTVYSNTGQNQKSNELFRDSIALLTSATSSSTINPLDLGHIYKRQGLVYESRHELKCALKSYQSSRKVYESFYNHKPHVDTAYACYYIGQVRMKQLNTTEALESWRYALKLVQNSLPENSKHEHRLLALLQHSIALIKVDIQTLRSVLDMQIRCLVHNPHIIEVYHYLAPEYIPKKVIAAHEDIAQTLYTIATLYTRKNEHEEALKFYIKALDEYEALYGKTSSRVKKVKECITKLKRDLCLRSLLEYCACQDCW